MVTLYFHFISRVLSNYNADLMEMVNAFVEDRIVYGPYFDHLASYWKLRNDPNLFILSFEQLSEVRSTLPANVYRRPVCKVNFSPEFPRYGEGAG